MGHCLIRGKEIQEWRADTTTRIDLKHPSKAQPFPGLRCRPCEEGTAVAHWVEFTEMLERLSGNYCYGSGGRSSLQ